MSRILILSGQLKDDFERIYPKLTKDQKLLITSGDYVTEEKLQQLLQLFHKVILCKDYYHSPQVEIEAIKLYNKFGFSRIITPATSEFDLLRAAYLREHLGIDGQNLESARAFRDKYLMKTIASEAGIKTPNFSKIDNIVDLFSFIKKYGYPVVIKPRFGVASIGTHLITSAEQLEKKVNKIKIFYGKMSLLVESFIQGKMFHIDGIIENDQFFAWPSIYVYSAMDMMQGKAFANHLLSLENPLFSTLINFAKKVLTAFPTPSSTAFHMELFQDQNKDLIFCEVASRSGGGYVNSMWSEAFGLPLADIFYHIQAGFSGIIPNKPLNPSCIPGSIVLPKKRGKIIKIASSCPLHFVKKYRAFHISGDTTKKSSDTMEALLSAFIAGQTEEDSVEKIHEFLEWSRQSIVYQ